MIKLSTSLLLLGLLNFAQGQTNTLPKPSGEYLTGVAYLNFVDESRKELFDDSGLSYREMTVKVWYPSDRQSDPEPYLLKAEADFVTKYLQFPSTYRYLNSKRGLGCGPLFISQSTRDCYSLSVKGSDHYNFTDYSVYPVPMVRLLLGPIDGKRTIEIMNVIIPAFFDKYVKGMGEIDLVKAAGKYPEMEISANLKTRGR